MNQPESAGALIRKLIAAWGDADGIASLVTEDAKWWITPTAGLPSPMNGRSEIAETMQKVFGVIYDPARTRGDIHFVLEDGDRASARFTMISHVLLVDRPYENEYALFIERDASTGLISHVWEYLDVMHASNQLSAEDTPS